MKIFVDTAPFIYLIENNPTFGVKVKNFLIDSLKHGYSLPELKQLWIRKNMAKMKKIMDKLSVHKVTF